jgi:hypothetical protein
MRYFIIFFNWNESGREGNGNHTEVGDFPVRKYSCQLIANRTGISPENVVITNIIELTKSDYDRWESEVVPPKFKR